MNDHDRALIERMREIVSRAFAGKRATWHETVRAQLVIDYLEAELNAEDQTDPPR